MDLIPVIIFSLISVLVIPKEPVDCLNSSEKEMPFSLINTINQLSLSFLPDSLESNENVIFSPLSIIMGLGLLAEGAIGNGQQSLLSFLTNSNQTMDKSIVILEQLRSQFKRLIDQNSSNDSIHQWEREMVNLIMVATDYEVKDDYKSTVESVFDGLVVNRDFKSNNNLVDEVNQLVANKTNNMIKKALDGPIDPNTKLLILNAFSFEGDWVHPFPKSLIIQRPFFGFDIISPSTSSSSKSPSQTTLPSLMASSVKNLTSDRFPFMTTSLRTNYAEIDEKDMKIIQLDYLGNASMIILLPNQKDSLLHLVRNLTVQEIDSYIESRLTQGDIDIEIPKFTFEVQYNLMERLEKLRLSITRTDYTGIAERIGVEKAKVDKGGNNDTFSSHDDAGAEGGENESSLNNKKSRNNQDSNNNSDHGGSQRRRSVSGDGIRRTGKSSGHSDTRDKELSRTLVQDQGHLRLTSAIHKSIIKVDEKGTKAAAFTGFGFHPLSTVSGQAQFIADHPFLFFIRDRSKGVNIFSGAVNKLTG